MVRRFDPKPHSPVPEPRPGRKPRRLGLYAPFALLLVAAVAWSFAWLWLSQETARRIDLAADQVRAAGYELAWSGLKVGGYPFRLNVTLQEPRVRAPSGWALSAPRLEAESYVFALGKWVAATPQGLTFTRPAGGPVEVRGELLRASLRDADRRPPRLSVEGVKLTFRPGPGARPFALSSAERVELHLRPGPDDQGAVFFKVDGGKAELSGLFARVADGGPVSMVWDSLLTRTSGFGAGGWEAGVRAWAAKGGEIQVRQAGVTAGAALIGVQPGTLRVGEDGRLEGALEVSLRQGPRALAGLAETGALPPAQALAAAAVTAARQDGGEVARATLTFQAGRTTLGPVALGPSPRVY